MGGGFVKNQGGFGVFSNIYEKCTFALRINPNAILHNIQPFKTLKYSPILVKSVLRPQR